MSLTVLILLLTCILAVALLYLTIAGETHHFEKDKPWDLIRSDINTDE